MKSKNVFVLAILILTVKSLIAQTWNTNPDPNGDIWLTGDVPPRTQDYYDRMESIPDLILWEGAANYSLPPEVDNAEDTYWFPEIDAQGQYGYCAQAAGIYYTFTYEINRLRNIVTSANNTYEPYFTWNALNLGDYKKGGDIDDGFDIVINNGCPTKETFPIEKSEYTRWMTGYANYYSSMQNRIKEYSDIHFNTEAGYEDLKHWIANHNARDET